MANLSIIRTLCKEKNISLVDLGKAIGINTPQGVQRIIKENSTTIEKLEKIAGVLNVPIWVFFDLEQESNYIREMEQVKNQIKINEETLDKMTVRINELNQTKTAQEKEISLLKEQINHQNDIIQRMSDILNASKKIESLTENVIRQQSEQIEHYKNMIQIIQASGGAMKDSNTKE